MLYQVPVSFFVVLVYLVGIVVVLSYPVRGHLVCLHLDQFASFFCFSSLVSQSVTTYFVSLKDEESGRRLGYC